MESATSEEIVWRKSSFSGPTGECVEVARIPGGGALVRDSKAPDEAVLRFSEGEWRAFVAGMLNGEFH
ncbi:DUF397 domain-containing protein [Nonomuraea africana]|uniref:DUF397 domain-containing protein n=1 Tax=Nonomuraea africana TaxID=46171 RepID=A0ABR9KT72_9ACTN|nr:DUF397 domain-containing protein [Nonomuraea africana]MBE1564926.1 hypothetical protein [Nonomuraea africana]